MKNSAPFLWSDAWLLLAVITAQSDGGASLEQVVGAGDFINHAIFTFEELDGGLKRLAASGLVSVESHRIRPTESASAIHAKAAAKHRPVLDALQEAMSEIAPAQGGLLVPGHPFSQEDLSQAYAQYRARRMPRSRARRRPAKRKA